MREAVLWILFWRFESRRVRVIEGITEWLPISSTGHMILAEQVLKFQFSDAFMEMFRVVIQLGAILAVVVLYFHKLWPFCADNGETTGFARHIRWPVMHLWFKIIAACAPAAVLGILLDDWFDAHLVQQRHGRGDADPLRRGLHPDRAAGRARRSTAKLSRINYKQAMTVGAWQVLSLVPGTSRSGATILGGMMCGMSRPCASQFTFFLAIPVMAGASALKLFKFFPGGQRADRQRGNRAAGRVRGGVPGPRCWRSAF